MTATELQLAAESIWFWSFLMGVCGGAVTIGAYWLLELVVAFVGRLSDRNYRIQQARWRARWNGFNREAADQGLHGREAVLWAANAMRTHRQALQELPHA